MKSLSTNSKLIIFQCIIVCVSIVTAGKSVTFYSRNKSIVAFAAAGFGGSTGSGSSTKKNAVKKKKKAAGGGKISKSKKISLSSSPSVAAINLLTPEGRMEYIRNRINEMDFSPMAKLSLRQDNNGQSVLDIDPNNICVIDNFLNDKELLHQMRKEAESLVPDMIPSQSTKWDESTQSVVAYEKIGVLSTQIEGGVKGYEKSPRLVEYVVTITTEITKKLNSILPDTYQLSTTEQTNKLAVCLGNGSKFDKHIDNMGGSDMRKITCLLYLQPSGSHDGQPAFPDESDTDDKRGGYFRAYDVPEEGKITCIAPRGDRLIIFFSDTLVHDVSPSYTPNNEIDDRRWALTTWFVVDKEKGGKIQETSTSISEKHFGTG